MFAPTDALFPSHRTREGLLQLIDPFFEFPLDVFAADFTETASRAGELTVSGVSLIKNASKFGRPLWWTYCKELDQPNDVCIYARTKLHEEIIRRQPPRGWAEARLRAGVAILDCRVLINYDPMRRDAQDFQVELVESFMRILWYVSSDREVVHSGYYSEPVLANAAAELLAATPEKPSKFAIDIISYALSTGLVARGERGELLARLLTILAHDQAVVKEYGKGKPSDKLHYQQPISLCAFLKELFTDAIWETIRKATNTDGDDETLEDAFADYFLNFTHFAQLEDHASYSMATAARLMKRGAAMNCAPNMPVLDFAATLIKGRNSPITEENVTTLQVQIKNSKTNQFAPCNPEICKRDTPANHPVISIILKLGIEVPEQPVQIRTRSRRSERLANKTKHYEITVFGCGSETFRCIPDGSGAIRSILYASEFEETNLVEGTWSHVWEYFCRWDTVRMVVQMAVCIEKRDSDLQSL